ncbi:MAG: hypothetical protein NT154_01570 [Verrucomicrobia bacterium]|nr:hypothetical protein [Verrucomicrobiota bacterium]
MKSDETTLVPQNPQPETIPGTGLGTRFMRGKIDCNAAILELAATFPTLRSSVKNWDPKRWHIDAFMSDVDAICSGA